MSLTGDEMQRDKVDAISGQVTEKELSVKPMRYQLNMNNDISLRWVLWQRNLDVCRLLRARLSQ